MEVIIIICIYCKIMNLMQMRLQRLFVIAFRILFQSLKQKIPQYYNISTEAGDKFIEYIRNIKENYFKN